MNLVEKVSPFRSSVRYLHSPYPSLPSIPPSSGIRALYRERRNEGLETVSKPFVTAIIPVNATDDNY